MEKLKKIIMKKIAGKSFNSDVYCRNEVAKEAMEHFRKMLPEKHLSEILVSYDGDDFKLFICIKGFEYDDKIFCEETAVVMFKLEIENGVLINLKTFGPTSSSRFDKGKDMTVLKNFQERVFTYKDSVLEEFELAYSSLKTNREALTAIRKLQEITGDFSPAIRHILKNSN